jgi:hypothetical protein
MGTRHYPIISGLGYPNDLDCQFREGGLLAAFDTLEELEVNTNELRGGTVRRDI